MNLELDSLYRFRVRLESRERIVCMALLKGMELGTLLIAQRVRGDNDSDVTQRGKRLEVLLARGVNLM